MAADFDAPLPEPFWLGTRRRGAPRPKARRRNGAK
jgi:hypothetical protein